MNEVAFTFDGRVLHGAPGDTLAAALLRADVRVVTSSQYLDRPRGIMAAGPEEPNALVRLTDETGIAPLIAATEVELRPGLVAESRRGTGRIAGTPDCGRRDVRHHHCDVLVVGAGPAGRAAAATAIAEGARVLITDRARPIDMGAAPAADLVALPRTAVVGVYDDGYALLVQRRWDAEAHQACERLWRVRAKRVVLATGRVERSIAFADNDRPGVMLAGAARAYVERFGVRPGRRCVVFTTNDSAYDAAAALLRGGVDVRALVDARRTPPARAVQRLGDQGVEVIAGAVVTGTDAHADGTVCGVRVARLRGDALVQLDCDLLAVSGGWSGALELLAGVGGQVRWVAACAGFVASRTPSWLTVVGAARAPAGTTEAAPAAVWTVPGADRDWSRHFVDLQRDVTVADLRSAVAAGLRSAEHVKRRTTLGTGRDQGRTANDLARGVLAELTGAEPESVVPARQRPPATPVSFAVMAGRERGRLHDPIRRTPLHSWHEAHGAPFEDVGRWKRPLGYPRDGEDLEAATLRECRAVREDVGILDASTLGKIDVRGPDAAELLERLCATRIGTLGPGRCRYVVICGVDGMVLDDGVAMRLAPEHFVLTTTSGNAPLLLDWMEEWLQTEWPELDVHLTSVTDHWAVIAIAGPRARDLLRPLAREAALDRDAFAFMAVRETVVGGVGARLARVSFCGELAFELHVPARHAPGLWVALVQAGATPYGTEAMHVLRAEKGYPIIGQDTDGTVTPQDLGLDFAVADKPFVGRRSHDRPDARRTGRRRLVGLLPDDPDEQLVEGAALIATADASRVQGHVTSSYRSAALGRTFALGLLEDGVRRIGQRVMATTTAAGAAVPVTVHTSVFYDPEGRRRDGDDDLDAVR